MAIEPAPKVEAAKASAAKPRAAPDVETAVSSGTAKVDCAPAVEPGFAEPPTERGSLVQSVAAAATPNTPSSSDKQCQKLDVESMRATNRVIFEAPAAVVVGGVDRNVCEKIFPCVAERSFISYGEVKRYILIMDTNIFVYTEATDPSPLYTVPFVNLVTFEEDRSKPDFYSHTISPEANVGLPFENQSKASLKTLILKDRWGSIAFQFAFDKNEAGDDAVDKFVAAILLSRIDESAKKGF